MTKPHGSATAGQNGESPRRLVLVGAGHAHVAVLKALGERPMPGARVTLVTRSARTPYSGMLPGFVAGLYDETQIHIDAEGLTRFAGADLIVGEAADLDPEARLLHLADGERLAFDILSLDIGSTPNRLAGGGGVPVKPIGDFVERIDRLSRGAEAMPRHVAVVGTGPAGVELTLALHRRLTAANGRLPDITLLGREPAILAERSAATQRRLMRILAERGIAVRTGFDVVAQAAGRLVGADGRKVDADLVLWATESRAAPWLGLTGLALDAAGFVRVDEALRSVSHGHVFAAGDIAALPDPRPKAGVFAVREGPVLAENLRRAVRGEALTRYRPQRHWLTLLSTADGRAVADKWGISLEGRWVWRWKDWNDRRFVEGYNRLAAKGRRLTAGAGEETP